MKSKKKRKNNSIQSLLNHLDNDSTFSLFEVIVIILISVVFGIIVGYLITNGHSNMNRVHYNSYLTEIVNTYNSILDDYYDEVNEEKMSNLAIKGMVSALDDPYSSFLDEDLSNDFNKSVDGQYVGIGIVTVFHDEYNYISSVLKNSPAEKAGLMVGDIIISVDGRNCHLLTSSQLDDLLSGQVGTFLKLKVLRDEKTLSFVLKRDIIEIKNVTSKEISEDDVIIGYLKIDVFSSNSYNQFNIELQKLEKKNIDSLIIDLRNNPGGHLDQTRRILSLFFSKKTVLYKIEKNRLIKNVYSMTNEIRNYPVIILVNHDTASSAEVMASCFQDNYSNVHLVGSRTYGKGNIQKSISLHSGSSIKFTIESWLTSKNVRVDGVGIVPDVEVDVLEDEQDPFDTQLQTAISLLK